MPKTKRRKTNVRKSTKKFFNSHISHKPAPSAYGEQKYVHSKIIPWEHKKAYHFRHKDKIVDGKLVPGERLTLLKVGPMTGKGIVSVF